jgi:hypothetical protein
MHTVILKTPRRKVGDHWNGDTLDNRRYNLRNITQKKNAQNCRVSRNNTSGYTGVSYSKTMLKWEAFITVNRRRKVLGYFDAIEDAVAARRKAESAYYGEIIRSGCPPRIIERPTVALSRPPRSNNTSGIVGISLHQKTGKWMARVFTDKTTYYLGLHPTQDAAMAAIEAHHSPGSAAS